MSTNPVVSPAIEIRGLVKHFGTTVAVDGLDLVVGRDEIVAVLGPNGAGKTTTIDVCSTLIPAGGGTVRVAGYDVSREPAAVRQRISVTGQFAALDDELTGTENVELFGRLLGLGRSESRRRASELLERFSLADAAGRRVKTYSGGMRRRLDLAVSIVRPPEVLFLDEPTTGLDPRSRAELWDIVRDLNEDGTSILLTTQYLEEADRLAHRIVVIDHGRVVAEGTAEALKERVGGSVIEVTPIDPAIPGPVRDALAGLGQVVVEAETGVVAVKVADGVDVLAVARSLDAAGVAVSELGTRRPSLDEVFLALTGTGVDA